MPMFIYSHTGAIALLGLGLLACGGGAGQASTQATPVMASNNAPAGDPSCPVEVPGTSASVEDAAGGVALVFATTGDVAEVRSRAAEMARMHNDHHGKMGPLPTGNEPAGMAGHDHGAMAAGGGHQGHDMADKDNAESHAGHDMGGAKAATGHEGHAGGMIGVHSRATLEETPDGARLVFVSVPADLAKLRDELGMHARHLASGSCSMGGGG